MQISHYYSILLLGILIFFSINGFFGRIVFGYGLGDTLFLLILWGITIISFIAFLFTRNNEIGLMITNVLSTVLTIWIILMATIWRSVEYKWNGEVFYIPCRTEIQINNDKISKIEVLTMCTGSYDSDFIGVWNGHEIEKNSGEIKIPKKLQKHLDYPIQNVLIQPFHLSQWKNGIETKRFLFSTDTLEINKNYNFRGEVMEIVNRKPVIKVYPPKIVSNQK